MRLSAKIAAIEIAGDEVRLALVRTGGARPTALALHACRAVYARPEERRQALVEAVRKVASKIKPPSAWALCADSRSAVARVLRLAFRGARRVAAAVPFELEPFLAVPLEDLAVDFTTIREVDGETEVLAVGVRRDILTEQIAILRDAGIEPENIGLDVAGVTAAWMTLQRKALGLRAILHLRKESALLSVTYGRGLAYFRTLPFGAERFAQDPAAAARNVENGLRSFTASWKGEETVSALSVIGAPKSSQLYLEFEEALSLPVAFEELLSQFKGADRALNESTCDQVSLGAAPPAETSAPVLSAEDAAQAEDSSVAPSATQEESVAFSPQAAFSSAAASDSNAMWEAVVGVAVGVASFPPTFEFARDEFAPASSIKTFARRLAFSGGVAALALLLGAGYLYETYVKNRQELERVGDQIWQVYAETIPESERALKERPNPDIGGARTAESFMAELQKLPTGQGLSDTELFEKPNLLDILTELGQLMPEGKLSLTDLRLTAGREKRIIVTGEIQDPAAFETMMAKLRESKILKVDMEPTKSMNEGKSTFSLNAAR